MRSGKFGFFGSTSQSAYPAELVFPLTYDEKDASNALTLTRTGSGPHVTPFGFEGDGCTSRYTYSSIPSWATSGAITLAASVKVPLTPRLTLTDMIAALCQNSGSPTIRIGLQRGADAVSATYGGINVVSSAATTQIARPGWSYVRRTPELSSGSNQAKPQGALYLSSTELMFSVHFDDTESRVYKLDADTGELLGTFTFGGTYPHVSAFARTSSGDIWAVDYTTGFLLRIDVDDSFSTGSAVILQTVDASAITGIGHIEFVTISGTQYLMAGVFSTTNSATVGEIYFIPVSSLSGSSISSASATKFFYLGPRVQGIAMRNGYMLVSRNRNVPSSSIVGYIEEIDIVGAFGALSSGTAIYSAGAGAGAGAAYYLNSYLAPSAWPEDIAVHPVTNGIAVPTEGRSAVGDTDGFMSVWYSTLDRLGEEVVFDLHVNASGVITVKMNNQLWGTISGATSGGTEILTIGGYPTASAGLSNGFTWATIKNVVIKDTPLTNTEFEYVKGNGYESSTLTAYDLTLVNPGAESGSATGWTNEVGTLTARNTADRKPPQGTWYFDGGSNVQTRARQRLTLASDGVSGTDIDTGALWAKLRWWQAPFDNNDPGGMGFRMLDGSSGTISTDYSPLVYMLGGPGSGGPFPWYPRSYTLPIPTTTRSIDAIYNASGRTSGTNNDHYVDYVRVTVYKP